MSAPHVALDLRILDPPGAERTGLGRYALEVARALARARPEWHQTRYTNRRDLLDGDVRATRWPTATSAGRVAWLHGGALPQRWRKPPDVWFSPSFVLPVWWPGAAVVTVHDLAFLLMRERYRGRLNAAYATRATRWSVGRANRVVCGSSETRDLIVQHLSVDPGRIAVIPYGVTDVFRQAGDAPEPDAADPPLLLYVGAVDGRKGLDVLMQALDRVNRSGVRVRLVVAGRPGRGAEAALATLRSDPAVEMVDQPDDQEVAELYRRALALIYPSRMEGFGLPVAEAMVSGCPVIASDLACIREYAGDAPLYAGVGDAEGLADRIELLLADPEQRAEMVSRGRVAAEPLRWDVVGERTAVELERAMGAPAQVPVTSA